MMRARQRKWALNSRVCERESVQKKENSNILLDKVKYWDLSQPVILREGKKSGCQGQQGGVENKNMSHFPFPIQFLSPVTAARGQASVLVELQGPSKTAHWKNYFIHISISMCISQLPFFGLMLQKIANHYSNYVSKVQMYKAAVLIMQQISLFPWNT